MRFSLKTAQKSPCMAGHLLIASPKMLDPKFHRAVLLILNHSENGAMGVVLNRPLPVNVPELWKALGDTVEVGDDRAHLGGPLSGSITVLHDVKRQESQGRIYVLEKCDQLAKLLDALHDESYRFFIGHAGWSKGQLEAEIENGLWMSIPGVPALIFEQPANDMWLTAVREAGSSFYRDVLKIRRIPANPLWN